MGAHAAGSTHRSSAWPNPSANTASASRSSSVTALHGAGIGVDEPDALLLADDRRGDEGLCSGEQADSAWVAAPHPRRGSPLRRRSTSVSRRPGAELDRAATRFRRLGCTLSATSVPPCRLKTAARANPALSQSARVAARREPGTEVAPLQAPKRRGPPEQRRAGRGGVHVRFAEGDHRVRGSAVAVLGLAARSGVAWEANTAPVAAPIT